MCSSIKKLCTKANARGEMDIIEVVGCSTLRFLISLLEKYKCIEFNIDTLKKIIDGCEECAKEKERFEALLQARASGLISLDAYKRCILSENARSSLVGVKERIDQILKFELS